MRLGLADNIEVGQAIENGIDIPVKIVSGNSALDYDAPFTNEVQTIEELLSPVSQVEAGTVRCVGLNYKEHAAEMKLAIPKTPTLVLLSFMFKLLLTSESVFLKASTCIASASEPIVLPANVDYDEADYEVELAVVIGRFCKNVPVSEAADYVLGYSVANDVTARKHQDKTSQWSYAKGMVCQNI